MDHIRQAVLVTEVASSDRLGDERRRQGRAHFRLLSALAFVETKLEARLEASIPADYAARWYHSASVAERWRLEDFAAIEMTLEVERLWIEA
ncbi:MAG: hypothetical protein U1E38_06095 [Rhodospirillales bacterium]